MRHLKGDSIPLFSKIRRDPIPFKEECFESLVLTEANPGLRWFLIGDGVRQNRPSGLMTPTEAGRFGGSFIMPSLDFKPLSKQSRGRRFVRACAVVAKRMAAAETRPRGRGVS